MRKNVLLTLGLSVALAFPLAAQDDTHHQDVTKAQKEQSKQQEKADKAQAKADKAKHKALDTDEQKKADKAQGKANREAEKAKERNANTGRNPTPPYDPTRP